MSKQTPTQDVVEVAASVLGVAVTADDEQLRAAYLEQVRLHPPDQDPDRFEKVRDAYELLRSPSIRAAQVMQSPPALPLAVVLEGLRPNRRFVGPSSWLAVLKENRP